MSVAIENEILSLERQFWSAMRDADVASMKALSDETCILTGTSGVTRFKRDDFDDMMKSANYKILDFEINDAEVLVLNDSVAVVGYKVNEKLTVDGKPISLQAVDSSTWIKKDGRWVCSLHTEALIGDPFGRDKTKTT